MNKLLTSRRNSRWWLLLLPCTVLLAYFPLLDQPLFSDDFLLLSLAAEYGLSMDYLFWPHLEHVFPLYRLTLLLYFQVWGTNPIGYKISSLVLHALLSLALFAMSKNLGFSKTVSFGAAIFFAFSASHWQAVAWTATQGQQLSGLFIVASLMSQLRWIEHRNLSSLLLSGLCYFLALCSSSFGAEFILSSLPLAYYWARQNNKGGCLLLSVFGTNALFLSIYLFTRVYFAPEPAFAGSPLITFSHARGHISEIFLGYFYGIILNFGGSISGSIGFDLQPRKVQALLVLLTLMIWIAIFTFRRFSKAEILLLICLAVLAAGAYLLPAIARAPSELHHFVSRSRYCYNSGIFLSPILAFLVSHSHARFAAVSRQRSMLPAVLALVFLGNLYHIHRELSKFDTQARWFTPLQEELQRQFEQVKTKPIAYLIDSPIALEPTPVIPWSIRPSQLCLLSNPTEFCKSLIRVPKDQKARIANDHLVYLNWRSFQRQSSQQSRKEEANAFSEPKRLP